MPYGDYLALGETLHHEYYDGQLVVNPPSRQHVRVVRRLTRLLEDACPRDYEVLPEAGWRVGAEEDYEPDLMVARIDAPSPEMLTVPPLLVVEVTSRSSRQIDLHRKMSAYARGGCPWYWVVDMDEQVVRLHELRDREYAEVARVSGREGTVEHPFPVALEPAALFAGA